MLKFNNIKHCSGIIIVDFEKYLFIGKTLL